MISSFQLKIALAAFFGNELVGGGEVSTHKFISEWY
jgi:hypothetical protein